MKTNLKNYKKGSAMLMAVIFFLIIALLILTGVSSPVLREIKLTDDLVKSKQSLYSAESGAEDVLYRLKFAQSVNPTEELSLLGYTTLTTITDELGGKTIVSEGDWDGFVRTVTTKVSTGSGVAFNYGIQTGNGGFYMSNNAGVIGNVYSNGDIQGSSGVYVTGSAVAANSSALISDQSNTLPLPPLQNIIFGNSNGTQDFAQSFEVSTSSPINKISIYIKKVGTPGNATVRIMSDSSGSPSNTTLASGTLSASHVTSNYGWIEVVFSSNPVLSIGTTYWLVIDGATNSSRYYIIGGNDAYAGGAKLGRVGSSWSTNPYDGYFNVYLGGITSSISNVLVGESGEGIAHAHTVTNSVIAGTLYCQTGSGNNKACDTSLSDPAPQPYPVSDANIDEWKNDAETGGVIIGDYTVTTNPTMLGPVKITGDLTVSGSMTLVLTGTVWVEGNIIVDNGSTIRLSSSYGTNSGIIIADGYIRVTNNGTFGGSGDEESYILALTTSDCPQSVSCGGNNAIHLYNNVTGAIFNAQNGTLYLGNNAEIKEATAYKMQMDNNTTVIYESGVATPSFTSGPSGGWNINSWKETE